MPACQNRVFIGFSMPSLHLMTAKKFPFIDKLSARAHKSGKDVAR
jgi:hypothetical protein